MAITKTAYLFRSFAISLTDQKQKHPTVNLARSNPLALKCKCDNFASSVTLFVPESITDNIFEFKYLTFDKSAIFEITDCIRNDDYYTLFIDFLTNIKFDTPLTDFSLSRITPGRFNGTGFPFRDFAACLNTNKPLTGFGDKGQPDFMWALRVELSEIPQNLSIGLGGLGNPISNLVTGRREDNTNLIFRPLSKSQNELPLNEYLFNEPQNNIVAIIPLPMFDGPNQTTKLNVKLPATTFSYSLTWKSLISTLNKLISDLVLKISIIPFSEKTIAYYHYKPNIFSQPLQNLKFTFPSSRNVIINIDQSEFVNSIGASRNDIIMGGALRQIKSETYPIFLTLSQRFGNTISAEGVQEAAPLIPFAVRSAEHRAFVSHIKIFNQLIDVSDSNLSDLYIQNFSSFLRVYTDFDKNEYVDVPNTFEFSKSAYSNYEAYTAANINLSERQKNAALDMQQKQQRETTYTQMGINLAASGVQAAIGVATGNPVSAASAASTAFGAVSSVVSTEMGIANAKANFKLEMEQLRERETQTIKTGNILSGSITINDFIFQEYTLCSIFEYYYNYTELSDIEKERIYKYMIKNNVMITLESIRLIQLPYNPDTIPANYPYQLKFITRGNTTNKDFIILGRKI